MDQLNARQNDILELIKNRHYIRNKDLADKFQVSQETIRRDLAVLENAGHITRSHGGATYKISAASYIEFQERTIQVRAEKEAVAYAASSFIYDNEVIVVLSASTNSLLIPYLTARKNLLVLTNSLQIGMGAAQEKTNRVIFLGGDYDPNEFSTYGTITDEAMENFHPDKAFISPSGISLKDGITIYSIAERNLLRKAIERSREVYVLADSTKFSVTGLYSCCGLSDISAIITDWRISQKILSEYEAAGIKIIASKL